MESITYKYGLWTVVLINFIHDSKELYYSYEKHKEKIESELGFQLEWLELPNKKAVG